MPSSGDVVELNLGVPAGREAGFKRPAVLITAQGILDETPAIVHVVPLTSTLRGFGSEVEIEPDRLNGLASISAAQCQHVRAVAAERVERILGNVG